MSNVAVLHPGRRDVGASGRWLSAADVCDLWPGMTVRKLQRMRDEGRGPAYSKDGRTIAYAESDVVAYLRFRRVSTREQS